MSLMRANTEELGTKDTGCSAIMPSESKCMNFNSLWSAQYAFTPCIPAFVCTGQALAYTPCAASMLLTCCCADLTLRASQACRDHTNIHASCYVFTDASAMLLDRAHDSRHRVMPLTWWPNELALIFVIRSVPTIPCAVRGPCRVPGTPTQGGKVILPEIALQMH